MPGKDLHVILFGDSDFDQWPKDLLPNGEANCSVFGYSGALLSEVVSHLDEARTLCTTLKEGQPVWFLSAGENDACQQLPLRDTENAFVALLDGIEKIGGESKHRVFCLGPKFEPWLAEDAEARKRYIQLARSFEKECSARDNVTYVDCLTMFCTGADQPGSLLKATPIESMFAKDRLHLGREGYAKWKVLAEDLLK